MLCMVKQWKTWRIELCKSKVALTPNKPAYDLYILDISKYEEMFDFRNFSSKSKYYHHSSKLVVGELKDEVRGVAVKEFVGLKHRFIHSW